VAKRKTLEEFKNDVYKKVKDEYVVTGSFYKNNKTPIAIKHNCGHEYEVRPDMFVKGRRCPKCANRKRNENRKVANYLEKLLIENPDGLDYVWLEKYNHDNKEKLLIRHNCGHEYRVRPNDFQQGYRCPKCRNNDGASVKMIKNILRENNINFIEEKTFDGLNNHRELRFDIYIPEYNLVIEYDGLQHFKRHKSSYITEEKIIETSIRDNIKNNFVIEKSINMIRINYKIKNNKLKLILNELIENNFTLSDTTIYENNLFYKQNKILINKENYYTQVYKNYFKRMVAVNKLT